MAAAAVSGTPDQQEPPRLLELHKPGPYNPAAALPPRVVKRILALEFTEMSELRADIWPDDNVSSEEAATSRRRLGKSPVMDIRIWLECFARLAAVLVTRFPEKAPELWSYQTSIVKAAHTYEGSNWVSYDRQYRRDMLAKKDLNWSVPNNRLFSEAFTGRARSIPRCPHCFSEDHTSAVCPFNPTPPAFGWFHSPQHLMALSPLTQQTPPQAPPLGRGSARREICRNFNRDRCYMSRCRFLHICMECNGPHPSAHCPMKAMPPGRPISSRGRGVGRGQSPLYRQELN